MNEFVTVVTILVLFCCGVGFFGWLVGIISAIHFPIERERESGPSKVLIGVFLVLFNVLTALGFSFLMNPSSGPTLRHEYLCPTIRSSSDAQKNVFIFQVERSGRITQECIIGEKVYFTKW